MTGEMMKALGVTVVGKKAEVVDVPKPQVDDDSVIVKTHYSGVSIGTEMWVATGRRDNISDQLPYVNGYQASGEVTEVGANVEHVSAGDMAVVCCAHAHAQYVKAPRDYVHRLSDPAKAKAASLFVMPSVGAHALTHADVNTPDTVLIVGQGLIGQCAAQLARLRGAYVAASEVSPERIAISEKYCADWVIDARHGRLPEQIKERFPDGFDVVMESTGFQELIEDAMLCVCSNDDLNKGGKFVFLGWYPDTITYTFHIPHSKQIQCLYPAFIGPRPNREGVLRLIVSGKLEIEPLISHLTPWQESGDIYSRLFTEERNSFNAIVIDWTA